MAFNKYFHLVMYLELKFVLETAKTLVNGGGGYPMPMTPGSYSLSPGSTIASSPGTMETFKPVKKV